MCVDPEPPLIGARFLLKRAEVVLLVVLLVPPREAGLHHLGVHEAAAGVEIRDLEAVFAPAAHLESHGLPEDQIDEPLPGFAGEGLIVEVHLRLLLTVQKMGANRPHHPATHEIIARLYTLLAKRPERAEWQGSPEGRGPTP